MRLFKSSNIGSVYCKHLPCKLENVKVKCGEKDDGRRKRSTSNTRLEIDFQMKIPLPKNASSSINQTVQNVQSSVLESINKSVSVMEVRGVKFKLDGTPTLKYIGLTCENGYVLKSYSCGKCYITVRFD